MKTAVFALSFLMVMSVLPDRAHGKTPKTGMVDLTVSVFNDVGAAPAVLLQAQTRAVKVMEEAGVSLSWVDCGTPGHWVANSGCTAVAYPRQLSVRIVARSSGRSRDTFGESFQDGNGDGCYALVYFRVLAVSQAAKSLGTGELLGLVVAHELGHLLLGTNSHSAAGLMAPVWLATELGQAAHGMLLFSTLQAEQMRSRYRMAVARHLYGHGLASTSAGK